MSIVWCFCDWGRNKIGNPEIFFIKNLLFLEVYSLSLNEVMMFFGTNHHLKCLLKLMLFYQVIDIAFIHLSQLEIAILKWNLLCNTSRKTLKLVIPMLYLIRCSYFVKFWLVFVILHLCKSVEQYSYICTSVLQRKNWRLNTETSALRSPSGLRKSMTSPTYYWAGKSSVNR